MDITFASNQGLPGLDGCALAGTPNQIRCSVPVNPRCTGNVCSADDFANNLRIRFDGGDRIVTSGGPISFVHNQDPKCAVGCGTDNMTIIGGATEVLSKQAFQNATSYSIPIGESLWTGDGTASRNRFPEGIVPSENNCSLAFRLDYGGFSYFIGGDMAGVYDAPVAGVSREGEPAWTELESAVAWVTGPVDVNAVNHHGTPDAANRFFLSILRPRVHILSTYASSQPGPDVLRLTPPLTIGRAEVDEALGVIADALVA